jgi:hypothetical protein
MSDKKQPEAAKKLTRQEIEQNKNKLLLATLSKSIKVQGADSGDEVEEIKHDFDDNDTDPKYTYQLKPNINHILRDQAAEDEQNFDEVLVGKVYYSVLYFSYWN